MQNCRSRLCNQIDLLGNWQSAPLQLTWPTCFQGYLQDSGSSPMNLQAQWWTQNVQSWPWSSIIHFGFCWIKKSKIFWSLFQCFRLMSRMHVFGWSGSIATFAGQNYTNGFEARQHLQVWWDNPAEKEIKGAGRQLLLAILPCLAGHEFNIQLRGECLEI